MLSHFPGIFSFMCVLFWFSFCLFFFPIPSFSNVFYFLFPRVKTLKSFIKYLARVF